MREIESGILLTNELLTKQECKYLIFKAEAKTYQKANNGENFGRYNLEAFLKEPKIFMQLVQRLQNEFASTSLELEGLTDTFEMYKYGVGQYIKPHHDAFISLNDTMKSNHTLVIYLNSDFKDGETVFTEKSLKVRPNTGYGVLFQQNLIHEGGCVTEGEKYILRFNAHIAFK